MPEIGYALSSEEHGPNELVQNARHAEEAGFTFALISDHFHPWIDRQGQSSFVWSTIGAISQATKRLRVGTGVTCPLIRIHPAIIAQAAATAAVMMPGRFFLGVGTGENLNEHILGDKWPPADVRQMMLEEAVEVIRELWKGEVTSHYGTFYSVENARIYTLPDELPPILVAASKEGSAELGGQIGDGLISTAPEKKVVQAFREAGGEGKPCLGQLTVCWAADEKAAKKTAMEWWPNAGLGGQLSQEIALPQFFEQACKTVREEDVTEEVVCGPDPSKHIEKIQKYFEAGFTEVYIHQIGPDQAGFIDFYRRVVLPEFQKTPA